MKSSKDLKIRRFTSRWHEHAEKDEIYEIFLHAITRKTFIVDQLLSCIHARVTHMAQLLTS